MIVGTAQSGPAQQRGHTMRTLVRSVEISPERADIVQRLAATADLLVVCDLEGTLTESAASGVAPGDGSLRLLSELASLPDTSVALIAHDPAIDQRVAESAELGASVELIRPLTQEADGTTRELRKDLVVDGLLAHHQPTLIFYAGNDDSDEVVFTALGIDDIGCKIGAGETRATLRLDDPRELVAFLARVLEARRSTRNATGA
jgi:trehalose-6-phosphatase